MSEKLTSNGLGSKVVRSVADHIPVTLVSAQNNAITLAKTKASKNILDKWSFEKQMNAALGLLSQSETVQLKADIQQSLDLYEATKTTIMAISSTNENDISKEELDIINAS